MNNFESEEFVKENTDFLITNIDSMLAFSANAVSNGVKLKDLELGGVEDDFVTRTMRPQQDTYLTAEAMQPDVAEKDSDRPPLSYFDLAEYLESLDDHLAAEQAANPDDQDDTSK